MSKSANEAIRQLNALTALVANNPKLGWYGVGTDDHTIPIRWFKSRKKAEQEAQILANRHNQTFSVALCVGRSEKCFEDSQCIYSAIPQARITTEQALMLVEALVGSLFTRAFGNEKTKIRAALSVDGREAFVSGQGPNDETPQEIALVKMNSKGRWIRK